MDLREVTRETQQARKAIDAEEYADRVDDLAAEQEDLAWRIDEVREQIAELPEGREQFGKELKMLADAGSAMEDAHDWLEEPETGPVTIAAETEAIEHLLATKRSKGGGGGGGGSPSGAGYRTGQTNISALAMAGRSENPDAEIGDREVAAAAGRAGPKQPAELRKAMDRYFEKLNAQ